MKSIWGVEHGEVSKIASPPPPNKLVANKLVKLTALNRGYKRSSPWLMPEVPVRRLKGTK